MNRDTGALYKAHKILSFGIMAAKKVDDIPFEDEEDPEDELTSMSESYRRRSIGDIEDAPAVRAHCVLCCVVLCCVVCQFAQAHSFEFKKLEQSRLSFASQLLDRGKKGYLDDVEKKAREYDTNGDGKFSRSEVFRIVEDLGKARKKKSSLKRYLYFSVVASVVLMLSVFGLMWAVVVLTRQVTTDDSGVLRTASGRREIVSTKGRGTTLDIHVQGESRRRKVKEGRRLEEFNYDEAALVAEIPKTDAEQLRDDILAGTTQLTFNFAADGESYTIAEEMDVNGAIHDTDSTNSIWYLRGIKLERSGTTSTADEDEPDPVQEYLIACPQDGAFPNGLPTDGPVSFLTDLNNCGVFLFYVPFAIVAVKQTEAIVGYRHFTSDDISVSYGTLRNDRNGNWQTIGPVSVDSSTDYTASFEITGLQPDVKYFYRIQAGAELLDPGVTQYFQTLPLAGSGPMTFTIFSDAANYWTDRGAPNNAGFKSTVVDPTFALQIGDFDHSDPDSKEKMRQLHRYMRAPFFRHGYALGVNVLSKMGFHHIWYV